MRPDLMEVIQKEHPVQYLAAGEIGDLVKTKASVFIRTRAGEDDRVDAGPGLVFRVTKAEARSVLKSAAALDQILPVHVCHDCIVITD